MSHEARRPTLNVRVVRPCSSVPVVKSRGVGRPPSSGLTEKWTFPPVDVSAVIVACLPGSCVDLSV